MYINQLLLFLSFHDFNGISFMGRGADGGAVKFACVLC